MTNMHTIRLSAVTGIIFYFFSERVFWSFFRTDENVLTVILGVVLYSLMAYSVLAIISYFNIRAVWAVFLAGAFFGWLGEGIVASTFFNSTFIFPVSLVFTGLSWHALLTVLISWYYVHKILVDDSTHLKVGLVGILIGLFWGVWAVPWALETPAIVASVPNFFLHSLLWTALYLICHVAYRRLQPSRFVPTQRGISTIVIIFSVIFLGVTALSVAGTGIGGIYAYVGSAVTTLILFALMFKVLRKNRISEQVSILKLFDEPVRLTKALVLLVIPFVATTTYFVVMGTGLVGRWNLHIAAATILLGFIMFVFSLVKIGKTRTKIADAPSQSQTS